MSVSGSVPKNSAKSDESNPAPVSVSSAQSPMQQLMALQTQVLQANSEMETYMRQVLSSEAMRLQDGHNDVGSLNPISSTTLAIPTVVLEKLMEMQTLVLQQVSQLTALSRQVLASQRSSPKGTIDEQLEEPQVEVRLQQPASDQAACKCCEFYGVPCRLKNAIEDEATARQNQRLFSGLKRKMSPQEQLLEDSLFPTALPIEAPEFPQKERDHKTMEDAQLRREALDRYLDEFTITCTVFQPPVRKRFKKRTNEMVHLKMDSSEHQTNNVSHTGPGSQEDSPSDHNRFWSQPPIQVTSTELATKTGPNQSVPTSMGSPNTARQSNQDHDQQQLQQRSPESAHQFYLSSSAPSAV